MNFNMFIYCQLLFYFSLIWASSLDSPPDEVEENSSKIFPDDAEGSPQRDPPVEISVKKPEVGPLMNTTTSPEAITESDGMTSTSLDPKQTIDEPTHHPTFKLTTTPKPNEKMCNKDDSLNLSNKSMNERDLKPHGVRLRKALCIDLSQNLLSSLAPNIIELSHYLRCLNLSDNAFEIINPSWFHPFANYLISLDISRNFLKKLDISQLPAMTHLEHLIITENYLTDIDEVNIMKKFVILKRIEFAYNYIGCVRSKAIQDVFEKKCINVNLTEKVYIGSKNSQYEQSNEGCINDGIWAALKLTIQSFSSDQIFSTSVSVVTIKNEDKNNGNVKILPVDTKNDEKMTSWVINITIVIFVTIALVCSVLSYFIYKLWKKVSAGRTRADVPSVMLPMYDGGYYEPAERFEAEDYQEPEEETYVNAPQTSAAPVYAKIIKKKPRIPEPKLNLQKLQGSSPANVPQQ